MGIVEAFLDLKDGTDADLLAMQVGDFYEFFGEDAETVGRELDLKVSERSSGGESYSMAGVPVDDLDPYVRALVERGYRVAVADQREADDGDHERELMRVETPGTTSRGSNRWSSVSAASRPSTAVTRNRPVLTSRRASPHRSSATTAAR